MRARTKHCQATKPAAGLRKSSSKLKGSRERDVEPDDLARRCRGEPATEVLDLLADLEFPVRDRLLGQEGIQNSPVLVVQYSNTNTIPDETSFALLMSRTPMV